MKKLSAFLLAMLLTFFMSVSVLAEVSVEDESYYTRFQGEGRSLNVHNWGEYISDGSDGSMDVIAEFEALTGIKVNYTTFSTNEEVYARLQL